MSHFTGVWRGSARPVGLAVLLIAAGICFWTRLKWVERRHRAVTLAVPRSARAKDLPVVSPVRFAALPVRVLDYFWLPTRKALLIARGHDGDHFRLLTLDAVTAAVDPLSRINSRCGSEMRTRKAYVTFESPPPRAPTIDYFVADCAPSPDGNWFLWKKWPGTWIRARLDGSSSFSETTTTPDGELNDAIWLRDSHSYVNLEEDYSGGVWRLTRGFITSLTSDGGPRLINLRRAPDGVVVGLTNRGSVLLQNHDGYCVSNVRLCEITLSGKASAGHSYTVPLPFAIHLVEAEMSPSGDRIGWMLVPAGRGRQSERMEFWVSDLAGQGMRRAGVWQFYADPPAHITRSAFRGFPEHLRWTGDGQRLTFAAGDALWALNVK